jgi:uncharacterized protein (DUF1800 family)
MKRLIALSAAGLCWLSSFADTTPPPVMKSVTVSNGVKTVTFTPAPATDSYVVQSGTNVALPLSNDTSGVLGGTTFRVTNSNPYRFYRVGATPMSSNALLTANVLNRLAYGPTPDEIERVNAIGAQAYINEQLAPENISESIDNFTGIVQTTNGVPPPGTPQWKKVSVVGTFSTSSLYVYLTQIGDGYIDDISLIVNTNGTPMELVADGDFEAATLAPYWTLPTNMLTSALSSTYAHSGTKSLHMVANFPGSTLGNVIFQTIASSFNVTQQCVLSYWYLEATNSSAIKGRLSGSGINASGNDTPSTPQWFYATATGTATATKTLYLYLDDDGECFIDDIKLVAGSVPEVGPNLLSNGDFESALMGPWLATANFTNSYISTSVSHSGAGSLKLIGTAGGSGNGNSFQQSNITAMVNGATNTVSFWYTMPTGGRALTVRLSGAQPGNGVLLTTQPDSSSVASIKYRLDALTAENLDEGFFNEPRVVGGARLQDLRAFHVMRAVNSKRQLLEILLQFLENHFVTQHTKSSDYFDRFYDDGTLFDVFATDWEYRENKKWRAALLNPNCTFYDLLRISAESPAMIVYLDSVDSNGFNNNIANENYAREVMELFCMGVDNGYDQQDITVMSRSWSGWSVDIVDPWNIDNPLATKSARVGFYPGAGSTQNSNLVGVWTFNFKSGQHGTNRAPVWCVWNTNTTNPKPIDVKRVPARFGPPWAGQAYNLYPTNAVPVRTGTNGLQDGYDVIAKIADLPFTMEFISAKLCRLFVHDDFVHGVYDYTDPNRSAEAELVRQCMVAWDTPVGGRKGNIRLILSTIFNSALFRGNAGSMQKIKTPLEFSVSAIRALHGTNNSGGYFSSSDGYSIGGRRNNGGNDPLARMGSMFLFNRDAPDGYPEAGAPWISAGTLAERVRFIQSYLAGASEVYKSDSINTNSTLPGNFNTSDPVGLLKKKLLSADWNNAGVVVDYFLGILYPGEGKANLDAYRTQAINFLNTADSGTGSSPFNTLGNTTAAYDTRVRAMVSMLMTLPRFDEQ